jgi:hypothetical protein
MQDPLGMEILQASEDLGRERLGDLLVKLAVFEETTTNRTTRNILQETIGERQWSEKFDAAVKRTC